MFKSASQQAIVAELTHLVTALKKAVRGNNELQLHLGEVVVELEGLLIKILNNGEGRGIGVLADTGRGKTFFINQLLMKTLDVYAYILYANPPRHWLCRQALEDFRCVHYVCVYAGEVTRHHRAVTLPSRIVAVRRACS